jgi:hypothetical protein
MGDPSGATFSVTAPTIQVPRPPTDELAAMKRHEFVRMEYERDRYLRHLDDGALRRRGNDIFRNIHQIDALGRVTLEQGETTHYWINCFTELIHEVQLRGYGPEFLGATIRDGIPLPTDAAAPQFRRAADLVARMGELQDPYLVKYTRAKYARDALVNGRIRLGPAVEYADPSLDPARFDKELIHNIDVDMSLLPFTRDGRSSFIGGPSGRLSQSFRLSTSFLVYCLSARLRARLFADFGEKAALIIRDPDAFLVRFKTACRAQLPGWTVGAQQVEYYDPLNVSPGELRPVFWKHFRYAYQEEVRLACTPPQPTTAIEPVFLELGSLEDIAHVVDTAQAAA